VVRQACILCNVLEKGIPSESAGERLQFVWLIVRLRDFRLRN
jgi:hypothetical protein